MENNTMALAVIDNGGVFVSMDVQTDDDRKLLYNAMSNPDERLSDMIGKVIMVKDVYCEQVEVTKRDGTPDVAPRTVLIDANGISYQAVSTGIFQSIKRLCAVYGMPTWHDPIPVEVRQLTRKENRILTLAVV